MSKMASKARRAPSTELSAQKPWPGPRSFDEYDHTYFFGRDAEIADLFDRIRAHTLTVLHGKSGLGKTSLLQAGVFPKLRKSGFFPLRILFSFDAGAKPLAAQIRSRLKAEIDEGALDAKPPGDDETLWHYFQHTAFWDATGESVIPVLVLDQFEETLQPKRWDVLSALVVELADLVENWVPQALLAKATDEAPPRAERAPRAKVVLSLREDYLAELDELRPRMPSLAAPRMRLGPLRWTNALSAVIDPATKEKLLGSDENAARALAEKIVRVVAGGESTSESTEGIEVESSILALYCYEINNIRIEKHFSCIDGEMVSSKERDKLLRGFYERCIAQVSEATRRLVEEELLSGGRRDMVAQDTVAKDQLDDIDKLVSLHLLRREMRLGRQYVEIVHDVLVKPISDCRDERVAKAERDAKLAREKAEQEAERKGLEEQRREAERLKEVAEAQLALAETQQKLKEKQRAQERFRFLSVGLVLIVLLGAGVGRLRSAAKQAEEDLRKKVEDTYRQAEQLGERAGASLADNHWDDAARTLAPALETLKDAQQLEGKFVDEYGPQALGSDAKRKTATLPLLARRFVGAMGASRLLIQEREGLANVVIDAQGRYGAALLADKRTIRLFDADHPEKPPWATDPLPSRELGTAQKSPKPGEVIKTRGFGGSVCDLALSGDGRLVLASADDGSVVVTGVEDGKHKLAFRSRIKCPLLSVDNAGRIVRLHERNLYDDIDTDKNIIVRLNADGSDIDGFVDFVKVPFKQFQRLMLAQPSQDAKSILTLWYDRFRLSCEWYGATIDERSLPVPLGTIEDCTRQATFSGDAKYFAVLLGNGNVDVWTREGEGVKRVGPPIVPQSKVINSIAFDPRESDVLLSSSDTMVEARRIDGSSLFVVSAGEDASPVGLLPKSPSGPGALVVETADALVVFEHGTPRPLRSLPLQSMRQRALRPEKGEAIVTAANAVRLISVADDFSGANDRVLWGRGSSAQAERTARLPGIAYVGAIDRARVVGNRLAMLMSDDVLFVDDISTGKPNTRWWNNRGTKLTAFDVGTSRTNAEHVVALDWVNRLHIGTPEEPKAVGEPPPVSWDDGMRSSLALSEDGQWVAAAFGPTAQVRSTEKPTKGWPWPPKTKERGVKLTSVAITSYEDAPRVAIGDEKGRIHVLHVPGTKLEEITPNDDSVRLPAAVQRIVWASPELFAAGDADGNVAVFSVRSKPNPQVSLTATLKRHDYPVTLLRFSPGKDHLLSADEKNSDIVVSTIEGAHVCTMPAHRSATQDIEFVPGSEPTRVLSRGRYGPTISWDMKSCTVRRQFGGDTRYAGYVGPSFVTISSEATMTVWKDDLGGGSAEEKSDQGPAGVLQWGEAWNGKLVASDDSGRVFWIGENEPPAATKAPPDVAKAISLVASSKTRLLALTEAGVFLDWHDQAGEPSVGHVTLSVDNILRAAALSKDGARLFLVEQASKQPSLRLRIVSGTSENILANVEKGPTELVTGDACSAADPASEEKRPAVSVTLTGAGLRVVSVAPNGCTRLWDDSGQLLLEAASRMGSMASLVSLSPRGDRLAVADENNALSFFEIKLTESARSSSLRRIEWEPERHRQKIRAITFHPEGRFAATVGDDGRVWLWDAESGKPLVLVGTHPGPIRWATFGQDGDHLYTGGAEAWLRSWDMRTKIDPKEGPDKLLGAIYDWLPELRPRSNDAVKSAEPN